MSPEAMVEVVRRVWEPLLPAHVYFDVWASTDEDLPPVAFISDLGGKMVIAKLDLTEYAYGLMRLARSVDAQITALAELAQTELRWVP